MTTARIYRPARSAMQSGQGNTKAWMFEFEPEVGQTIEPLMGWTSSTDTRRQVKITFDSKEEAIAFAVKNGVGYRVEEPAPTTARKGLSYADNFKFDRVGPWTH